jgi:hypothetical protein
MGLSLRAMDLTFWRNLHIQYSGADKFVQIAGRTKLLDVPSCSQVRRLDQPIDRRLHLFYEFGEGAGPDHAKTMCIRTLPSVIKTEIHRRPEVERLDLIPLVDWVRHQTAYEKAKEFIAHHLRAEKVTSLQRVPRLKKDSPAEPEAPPVAAFQPRPKAKAKAKAKASGRPQRIQAEWDLVKEFSGCYHCGARDHARTENKQTGMKGCPAFAKLKQEHGGVPRDYKGKLEEYLETKLERPGMLPRSLGTTPMGLSTLRAT